MKIHIWWFQVKLCLRWPHLENTPTPPPLLSLRKYIWSGRNGRGLFLCLVPFLGEHSCYYSFSLWHEKKRNKEKFFVVIWQTLPGRDSLLEITELRGKAANTNSLLVCLRANKMGYFAEKVEKEECNLTEWLERLTANSKVATAPGSIPASFDTVKP